MSIIEEMMLSKPGFRETLDAINISNDKDYILQEAFQKSGLSLQDVADKMELPVSVIAKMFEDSHYVSYADTIKMFLICGFKPELTATKVNSDNTVDTLKHIPPVITRPHRRKKAELEASAENS